MKIPDFIMQMKRIEIFWLIHPQNLIIFIRIKLTTNSTIRFSNVCHHFSVFNPVLLRPRQGVVAAIDQPGVLSVGQGQRRTCR